MRLDWVLGSLSVLITMGVAMIVFGQRRSIGSLSNESVLRKIKAEKLDASMEDRNFLLGLMRNQMMQKKKDVEELETEVAKLTPEEQKRKSEIEACQAEKAKKQEELASAQKEQTDNEGNLKTESDAWKQEMAALKQQVEQRSKVCDFVKNNTAIQKLCATT